MTDYISREAVLEMLKQECSPMVFAYLADLVNDIPTADVRYVARCQNCEMSKPCSDEREIYCTLNHCYKKKNWFCADGRDKNENPN